MTEINPAESKLIRPITLSDFEIFWPEFKRVILAQETYAFDPNMDFEAAYQTWCVNPAQTFVYESEGSILGSYYIKANAMGPGDHICNCGYMVTPAARGKGIARAMCEHSQAMAIEMGFKAMQFNSVVSSNKVAVKLWQKLGYEIIGTIPKGYRHLRLGFVDCFIMYRSL